MESEIEAVLACFVVYSSAAPCGMELPFMSQPKIKKKSNPSYLGSSPI